MSSFSLELKRACKRCNGELPPDARVCKQCHTLVHAEELDQLAAAAETLEQQGKPADARALWHKTLDLLPPEAKQTEWVHGHIQALDAAPVEAAPPTLIINLPFLVSLGVFLLVSCKLFGVAFGIGFTVQILIHELGHYIDIKRRGLPVDMPVFLPGLGAFVRWHALGVSLEARAAVSLAGPLAGWFAAALCALMWFKTGDPFWAALARAGAWLNLFNLIPVWALDGGQAFLALTMAHRLVLLVISTAGYFFLGESIFVLIAMGAAWRLFTKDVPKQPSLVTTTYFACVLVALGFLTWMLPGTGFGRPWDE